ncbi:hypothetical protein BBB02_03605 [Wolbachia endosymbiont of Bemisia tabaci]|uniref:hypothetical protein n=1 Tax=Wolbachia endosymbiont of Bemisia tabaci TaxID=215173 RepID=UPI000FD17E70|nr:hypothetical protein [Wolbachia endosymbiont of Bemisia tabaci]AZU37608.1 hypothetical protein BBB02_03605 [Wolbachia endosymbiont of Bemisia tabaci]
MSNDSKQKIKDNLKVIKEIEIDSRPKNYNEEVLGKKTAQVNYIHRVLDELTKKLNKEFVSQLDGVLNNNNESITKLENTLGNSDKGLVKALDDLKSRIQSLENAGDDGSGLEWEAPQLQYTDTELI